MGLMIDGWTASTPETNIVHVDTDDADRLQKRLEDRGVRCFAIAPGRVRLVLHLGIDDRDIDATLSAFASIRQMQ